MVTKIQSLGTADIELQKSGTQPKRGKRGASDSVVSIRDSQWRAGQDRHAALIQRVTPPYSPGTVGPPMRFVWRCHSDRNDYRHTCRYPAVFR